MMQFKEKSNYPLIPFQSEHSQCEHSKQWTTNRTKY